MNEAAYQILARCMRFVFLLLGALVFLLGLRMMAREKGRWRKEKKQLPDAGFIGEIVDEDSMKASALPHQGCIGESSRCDVKVSGREVRGRHADFLFVEGRGLRITPRRGAAVMLDGKRIGRSGYALHGSRLSIGACTLRVRLFAGLKVPERGLSGLEDGAGEADPLKRLGDGEAEDWTEMVPLPTDHVEGEEDYLPPFGEEADAPAGPYGRKDRGRQREEE